jgi:hypothetical protein
VVQTAGAISWNLTRLAAGANAAMQVLLRPGAAGWMTNSAFVSGYEPDPDFTNNISSLGLFVQLPTDAEGVFEVRVSNEDLIYDPMRDRLLLSLASGPPGQSNGIGVLNPYSGLIESFISLTNQPDRIVRSLDGRYLYVSLKLDTRVRRLNLADFSSDIDFRLGGESYYGVPQPYYAGDMAVVPGSLGSLVVWQIRAVTAVSDERGRGIAVFDDGIMRSNTIAVNGGSFALEFDTDQNSLYAFQGGWTRRCAIDASGISFSQEYPNLNYSLGNDMEYAAGQFFNSAGRAVRTQPFGVVGTYVGSESATLVEPDAASGRAFYLVGANGAWQLNAYSISTFNLLGSLSLSNVAGSPSSLIRWGTNGLAFRTTSNQLFIIRGSLVDPSSASDLSVTIEGPNSPVMPGSTALFVLTVVNQGPAAAQGVLLTNSFSPRIEVVWTSATDGQAVTNGGRVAWTIPDLPAGEEELLAVVVRPAQTGTYTVSADVFSATTDLDQNNNSAKIILRTADASGPESVSSLALLANDLVWSPSRGKLLVTVNSNQANWAGVLASVDPLTLEVTAERRLGPNVGRLAASDEGSRLYAALDYDVSCLDLATLSLQRRFPLDPLGGLLQVGDLEALHGSPDSVVAGRLDSYSADLAVFDNGSIRSNIAALATKSFIIEQGSLPSPVLVEDFYAGGFRRYTIDPSGATLLDVDNAILPQFTTMDLKWADGVLFSSVGLVLDPFTRTRAGVVTGITNNSPLCYDSTAQRVYYLSPAGTNALLRAVDSTTLMTVGTKSIGGISGDPASLIRWGADGLAFRTTEGQMFVLRTGLIPSAPAADLGLSITASGSQAFVGSNFIYSVRVTNAGPNLATNSQVLIQLSANAGSLSVFSSQGTLVTNSQEIIASLGTLVVGNTALVSLSLFPTRPGALSISAKAVASSVDPDMANNSRSLTNPVVQFVALDSMVVLAQPTADLAYNNLTGRLYASGDSQITVINPALSRSDSFWALPGAAGRLALSQDRNFLYTVLDAGYRLCRINVATGQPDFVFSPDDGSFGSLTAISDVAPVPGKSDAYVLCGGAAIHVYDGLVRRPVIMVDSAGAAFLQFGSYSDIVYGSAGTRLRTLTLDPSGIQETAWNDFAGPGLGDFQYENGVLYTPGGAAIDPVAGLLLGQFTNLGTGTVVKPDTTNQRVFFVTKIGAAWQLRAYAPLTFGLVGSVTLSNLLGQPTRLVRWGEDGLAFGTTSNQLFLLRSSLVSLVADTDHDGLPDYWEIANGLDPSNPSDALMDPDDDGQTNLQEFLAGTNPRDKASVLRISSIIREGGTLRLWFSSVAGKSYTIEQTPSLSERVWSNTISGLVGNGGPLSVTLSNMPSAQFIRLRAGQ